MVVTQRPPELCDASELACLSSVTRFVWSGDQLLWERKSAEGTAAYVGESSGLVSYTHAGGIDRPLAIWKAEVGTIVTHQNWRGQFARGTFGAGSRAGQSSDGPDSPPTNGCIPVPWPGWNTTAWHEGIGSPNTTGYEHYWMGSLATGMRDASGEMYMRNRYYDPQTGQFTQPDPIGLAGGLNAYGFAAGDPVSYSDPYGLKPEDVFVLCRPVGGEGGEGVAGHCAIRVVNRERKLDVTIELLNVEGSNTIVASGPGSKLASAYLQPTADNRVAVPAGMTSEEFDNAVLGAAAVEGHKVSGDSYLPFGDVNLNRYIYNVIHGAGGQVPSAASANFLVVPGICGGKMLSRGSDCSR